jgi:hypothetical protein
VAAGEFDFDAHLPGGRYKIKAYTNWMRNRNEVFERDITLQKVVLPNINLKLEFERKALGAGEVAIARFDAQTRNRITKYVQRIDGSVDFADENGKYFISEAQVAATEALCVDTDDNGNWMIGNVATALPFQRSLDDGRTWYTVDLADNSWYGIASDKKGTWIAVATTGTNRIVVSNNKVGTKRWRCAQCKARSSVRRYGAKNKGSD